MSALSRRRWDYDLLRVASMVGVVYLHTAAGALRQLGTPLWHFSNLLSSLATAAVPLFFMLSGALLLSHPRTAELGTLFRRRLPKVLIPLLAWSGVVIALAGVLSGPQAALDKLIPLLNTPVMVPYWFLYALVPIYLVSPLLKKMTDGLSEAHWNYLVGLWLIATIGMDTLCDLAPAGPWQSALTVHWTLNLDFVGGYLGYFLLGARLARLQKLPRRGTLWGVTAASFAVIAAGTFWLTSRTGVYDERIKSYLHLFYRRAGRGPVPAGALLWGGPEQRAGPHCLVRAVLRRLPGTPHGHPVLAEGVDGLDHPRGGHHPPPARLLSGHPAQLPGGRGPAHVCQAPVLALYRPELFLCLPGVQPVRPVPAEPFQANPGVLIMHSRAAHEAALLLNSFLLFFIKFMLTYSLLWRILRRR